jgi:hypothetical protein
MQSKVNHLSFRWSRGEFADERWLAVPLPPVPVDFPASLPCFPFFPWSVYLQFANGRGDTDPIPSLTRHSHRRNPRYGRLSC